MTGQGVLLIGAGGLGTAIVSALATSDLTRIGLADPDTVTLSNLPRQILYQTADIGDSKVTLTKNWLQERCPHLQVEAIIERLETKEQVMAWARSYAVIVDGSDNFITRFNANDAALALGIPLVYGAATAFRGQLMTIIPGQTVCLRCLFEKPPETAGATCQDAGILGPLVGEVGWLMAMEVVKLLQKKGTPLLNRLLTIDLQKGVRREIPLQRRRDCPGCG